jgi:hypothetical protein
VRNRDDVAHSLPQSEGVRWGQSHPINYAIGVTSSVHANLDDRLIRAGAGWRDARQSTIDDIPDDILLEIFDFYRIIPMLPENVFFSLWEWHVLAYVCRKWRQVLFSSPRSLGLRLLCTPTTPVREMLSIWPPLPIVIENRVNPLARLEVGHDTLLAALVHHNRVSVIVIDYLTRHQLKRIAEMMQEPRPAVTSLRLESMDEVAPVLSEAFMGGSAPLLQRLYLGRISSPTLPRRVVSVELTSLNLCAIPSAGYISPGLFLSPLNRLEELVIQFQGPHPPPDPTRRHVILAARALLPALIYFRFNGISEYLEDIIRQIDTPLLHHLEAVLLNQLIFTIPQFTKSIHRTKTLMPPNEMEFFFDRRYVLITFQRIFSLSLKIPCSPSD